MFNPSSRITGQALLFFGALLLGLSAFSAWQQAWRDAALWLAVAVFAACYGTIQLDLASRWRTLWLVLGLCGGGMALLIALISMERW